MIGLVSRDKEARSSWTERREVGRCVYTATGANHTIWRRRSYVGSISSSLDLIEVLLL